MLTPTTFTTFTDAYVEVLRTIVDGPHITTWGRSKDALEVPNVTFRLADPTARTPFIAARRANPVFTAAEFLWYVAGRNDLDMIGHYAPRLRKLSKDGRTLTGTAYGPRLFGRTAPDDRSQFDRALDFARHEPDSKRAAMIVMEPGELLDLSNPDVACTLALQLMLRNGQLHMTGYMRGNDARIGLLCDVHSFTMIQEFAARLLGAELGTYTHHVGSMHVNTADLDQVRTIIAEADAGAVRQFPAEPMPASTTWDTLRTVLQYEEMLRKHQASLTAEQAADLPLPGYWQRIVLLFEAFRQIVRTPRQQVTADVLAALDPGHRWLLAARWPDQMPRASVGAR
ncbi:thymidylate synthase [Dactylosporangium aurantiacum]|uniref:Thymidylate synthase n=1 Tax=Dactylosporangium aurantiacum TaxID=35754 RepID=A0A9Q9IGS1_9ACTN|nr:thymidylate synthase [Dactylosporangium aurantiacum]MDG6100501.1 thymidylate synthase [Dactylosporangium aurantiacum]UWZ55396.1 thymidylate synthase [Dactylosporangium aurantiacum]